MMLSFDPQHRLSEVAYDFRPGLTRPGKWTLAGGLVVAAGLLSWAGRWLWQRPLGTPQLPVPGARPARLVGQVTCTR